MEREKNRVEEAAKFSAFTSEEISEQHPALERARSRCGPASSASPVKARRRLPLLLPPGLHRARAGRTCARATTCGPSPSRRSPARCAVVSEELEVPRHERAEEAARLHPARDHRRDGHPRRVAAGASSTSTRRRWSSHVYAKKLTVATLLARSKMTDLEQKLYDKGFNADDDEDAGDFSDDGWPSYKWRAKIIAPKTNGPVARAAHRRALQPPARHGRRQGRQRQRRRQRRPLSALAGLFGGAGLGGAAGGSGMPDLSQLAGSLGGAGSGAGGLGGLAGAAGGLGQGLMQQQFTADGGPAHQVGARGAPHRHLEGRQADREHRPRHPRGVAGPGSDRNGGATAAAGDERGGHNSSASGQWVRADNGAAGAQPARPAPAA